MVMLSDTTIPRLLKGQHRGGQSLSQEQTVMDLNLSMLRIRHQEGKEDTPRKWTSILREALHQEDEDLKG